MESNYDKKLWKLYLSHILSTWGDNMWWFTGGLYMMKMGINPDENQNAKNLRFTAIYGFNIALSVILTGPLIGSWIDKTQRLRAAQILFVIQNLSMATASILLSLYLKWKPSITGVMSESLFCIDIGVFVLAILLSCLSKIASEGSMITIQKDWIVIVSNNDTNKLAKMNSVCKSIELTTYVLAPIVGGFLLRYTGYDNAGIYIGIWNLISVCFELMLLHGIYSHYPALHEPRMIQQSPESSNNKWINTIKETLDCWKVYFNHPVRNAGLGLALLYMTVLGFDNITYGYIILQDVPETTLGILVAISAGVGIAGSLIYPYLRKTIGLERTGLHGMFALVFMSTQCLISVFSPGSPFMNYFSNFNPYTEIEESVYLNGYLLGRSISVYLLLSGIISARLGLWITDLTINQILQENVEEDRRGTVNGVQEALNNTLDLFKCILVICFPYPEQFGILVILSFLFISTGFFMYALYSRSRRGHLFHFQRICSHQAGQAYAI